MNALQVEERASASHVPAQARSVVGNRLWHGLLPLALVLLTAAHATAFWHLTIDDAFISFRYARNLVQGYGLVFNPGEYVEGYTNFLWTLLMAGVVALGNDPEIVSKLLGLLSNGATVLLVWWWSNRTRQPQQPAWFS